MKSYLDSEGIENFIPMRYEFILKNERRVRKLVPAVHNLIFVYSSRNRIDAMKELHEITILLKMLKTKYLKKNSVSINVRLMKHVFLKISNR